MSFFTENLFPVGDWRWAVTAALFFGVAFIAAIWPKIRAKRQARPKASASDPEPTTETPAECLAREMMEIRECLPAFLEPEGPDPVASNRLRLLVEKHRNVIGGDRGLYHIQAIDAQAARTIEMLRLYPYEDVVRTIQGELTAPRAGWAREEWGKIVRLSDRRPWLRYMAVMDGRTRAGCKKRHGTILRWDHAWWRENFPPNHKGCRCIAQQLSDDDLDRFGYKVSKEPPK